MYKNVFINANEKILFADRAVKKKHYLKKEWNYKSFVPYDDQDSVFIKFWR